MHRAKLARWLLITAAISTLTIPIGVDAVLLANGHMNNPAWLPHAKLHCAMSFFAAASLGGAALAILKVRPTTDRFSMGLAAFLGSAFCFGPEHPMVSSTIRFWGVFVSLNWVVSRFIQMLWQQSSPLRSQLLAIG
jgi:hypothetical protein